MKIYLASDIHTEFGQLDVHNRDQADVLVLAGDIGVANNINSDKTFYSFLKDCSDKFKDVIYILGNHEHYNGNFTTTADIMKEVCNNFNNVHFLDNNSKIIEDVVFIGGTLWTDMNNSDIVTILRIGNMLNDFRVIKNSNRTHQGFISKFIPEDTIEEHKKTLKYFDKSIAENLDKKVVIVSHHTPSHQSIMSEYKHDKVLNGAFASDLTEFILEHPQIKLWCCGHTHHKHSYNIGNTLVACNPRGYIGYEKQANNFDFLLLEV